MYLSTAAVVGELSGGADGPPYLAGILVGHEVQEAIQLYRCNKHSSSSAASPAGSVVAAAAAEAVVEVEAAAESAVDAEGES
eukprot:COSAG01_NODE_66041_length_271_cov_0.901163_1_plen_81_part_01